MNINHLTSKPSPIQEFAAVKPREGGAATNQGIYPQEPDRPAPICSLREIVPTAKQIADIESELAQALKLANTAPTTCETTKDLPPSPKLEKLRAKIQDLAEQLR